MELAAQNPKNLAAKERTDADALALHGETYLRMMRIKEAASELSRIIFTHGKGTAEAQKALAAFDELIYPTGMDSEIAKKTARAFRIGTDKNGELRIIQVDPRTDLPPVD